MADNPAPLLSRDLIPHEAHEEVFGRMFIAAREGYPLYLRDDLEDLHTNSFSHRQHPGEAVASPPSGLHCGLWGHLDEH